MASVYNGERHFAFNVAIFDFNGGIEEIIAVHLNQEDLKFVTCRDLYVSIERLGIAGKNFTLSQYIGETIKTGEIVADISLSFKYANEEGDVFYVDNDLYKDDNGVCKQYERDLPDNHSELVTLAGPRRPMIVLRKRMTDSAL